VRDVEVAARAETIVTAIAFAIVKFVAKSGWETAVEEHLRPISGPQSDASRVKEFW
jgi:hypothetical protein